MPGRPLSSQWVNCFPAGMLRWLRKGRPGKDVTSPFGQPKGVRPLQVAASILQTIDSKRLIKTCPLLSSGRGRVEGRSRAAFPRHSDAQLTLRHSGGASAPGRTACGVDVKLGEGTSWSVSERERGRPDVSLKGDVLMCPVKGDVLMCPERASERGRPDVSREGERREERGERGERISLTRAVGSERVSLTQRTANGSAWANGANGERVSLTRAVGDSGQGASRLCHLGDSR